MLPGPEYQPIDLKYFDAILFHTPYCKLVQKSLARLVLNDFVKLPDKERSLEYPELEHFRYVQQNKYFNISFPCILLIKPTRCTNFSNLFLEQNSTCFRQVFCPSSGLYYCIHSKRYMSYRLCWLLASGIRMFHIPIAVYTVLDSWWWTETCLKHLKFYSRNKFEKLAHQVGFIMRLYHDAWSSKCNNFIALHELPNLSNSP